MLRITIRDKPGALTFQLEGRLAGPWVRVLQDCWRSALARRREPILRVDLTEVTSLDAAGRACLGALHFIGRAAEGPRSLAAGGASASPAEQAPG